MKTCETCTFANWKRTSNRRLHPDKTGRCTFKWEPPPLPQAFSLRHGRGGEMPEPFGGYIERGPHAHKDCACYEEKQK